MAKKESIVQVLRIEDVDLGRSRFVRNSPIWNTKEWKALEEAFRSSYVKGDVLRVELSESTIKALSETMKQPIYNFYSYVKNFTRNNKFPIDRFTKKTENGKPVLYLVWGDKKPDKAA